MISWYPSNTAVVYPAGTAAAVVLVLVSYRHTVDTNQARTRKENIPSQANCFLFPMFPICPETRACHTDRWYMEQIYYVGRQLGYNGKRVYTVVLLLLHCVACRQSIQCLCGEESDVRKKRLRVREPPPPPPLFDLGDSHAPARHVHLLSTGYSRCCCCSALIGVFFSRRAQSSSAFFQQDFRTHSGVHSPTVKLLRVSCYY